MVLKEGEEREIVHINTSPTFDFCIPLNYLWAACVIHSLGGLNGLGIKVAFSVHRGFFLRVRGIAGVHIVGRDGSCYGAQAGHGNLEQLCIKFLGFG